MITPFWPVKGRKSSIPFQRMPTLRAVAKVMNGSSSVAPSIALLPSAATISGNPSSTSSTSFGSMPPRSSALPSWVVLETPLPMTRELAALQVLEVADGVREVAADDDGGKAESLRDLALVGHQLHGDAAREGVEQGGRHRRAADLHLAGGDRRQDLRGRLEPDDLDVEPFVPEVALLLGDEDAGIGHRADGADLERHARIERRGLRRRGWCRDRERSRQARGERGGSETKTHDHSPWCGRRCGRQVRSCPVLVPPVRAGANPMARSEARPCSRSTSTAT